MVETSGTAADVSIIIAAYNVGPYIERAIASALTQNGITVEVIVVDNASTDATATLLSRQSDPRIKRLRFEENLGPSGARNAGIAIATAPWIAILDGDDVMLPERLARMLARAKTANADIVVDNIRVRRESDGTEYSMFAPDTFARHATLDLSTYIAGNSRFLGGATLGYLKPVFSTAFLRRHKLAYDPELFIGEDYMLLAEALAEDGVCAIEPAIGYVYTVRKGSISHRLTSGDIERIAAADQKFLNHHTLTPTAAEAQKQRDFSLREAAAFTDIIDALKMGDASGVFKASAACPSALRHLWRPVAARLGCLFASQGRR